MNSKERVKIALTRRGLPYQTEAIIQRLRELLRKYNLDKSIYNLPALDTID